MAEIAWRDQLKRRRAPLLTAASVAVHVIVVALLAVGARGVVIPPPPPAPPLVYLDIQPRPLLPGETSRAPRESRPQAREADAPPAARGVPDLRRPASDDEDDALQPRPRAGQPGAGDAAAAQGVDDAWRYRPESLADGVSRSLRVSPIGCNGHFNTLTPAEQALCDERFNARAAQARPITGSGDPERDARFAAQGERALAQYEGRRAPLAGGTGVVGPADCVGSNFGTGCAGAHLGDVPNVDMRQGARTTQTPSQKR